MNRLIRRVLAFIIDMMICTFIIVGMSSIEFLNPLGKKIDAKYEKFSFIARDYQDLSKKLDKIFKDKIISEKEKDDLLYDYKDYDEIWKKVKVEEKLSDKKIEDYKQKIYTEYVEIANHYGYTINRLTRYQTIISIGVYVLYFTVLEVLLKGQTLGKKLLRVKVVDSKDSSLKIPFYKYLLRTILVCEVIFLIVDLVLVMSLKEKSYLEFNYWLSNVKYVYEMAFILCIIVRDDQRSLHDLLFGTKVIRLDKNGNGVEDLLFKEVKDEEKVIEEEKNIVKKKKKKKEVVEAIKVNDKKSINKDN